MRVALDTTAYSALRTGHREVIDAVAAAASVLVPTIVLGELSAGFGLGSRERENRLTLDEFLREPFVIVAPITRSVATTYGELFVQLRRDGAPIPTNDIWIAATAMDSPATLLTLDSDFERIRGLSSIIVAGGPTSGSRVGPSSTSRRRRGTGR